MTRKCRTVRLAASAAAMVLAAASGLCACAEKENISREVPAAEVVTEPTTEPPTMARYDYVPSESGITDKARMLTEKNKDIVGWLKIYNTRVDYPIFMDPGEITEDVSYYGGKYFSPNSFYLDHNIKGEFAREGSLYMDYNDDFGSIESEQSENIVIYGHNMANNTMFGSIRRYRQDHSFFEAAPFIEMSSNYRDYNYVIWGCMIINQFGFADFPYWEMEELDTEEEFNNYIDNVRARQLFDTGVDVKYGDKLLTLSTCYADEDNSRFLVIARRLREGEVMGDLGTVNRTEEYIKAHTPTEPSEEAKDPE